MKTESTTYYIQVKDGNQTKIVPHTLPNEYKFLTRIHANNFKLKMKKLFPNKKFRLVTCKETYIFEEWTS